MTYSTMISNGTTGTDLTYDTFWQDSNISITTGTGTSPYIWSDTTTSTNGSSTLEVKGNANFEGDVTINGKNLAETLAKIEERLALITFNDELECKWEELKNLREAYISLEKEIIEKQKAWNILKR